MPSLPKNLRNDLARAVQAARSLAEAAARKALHTLGVDDADAPGHLDLEHRRLRVALRAQARQLGDQPDPAKPGRYFIDHLAEKIAYDQWHRMLFARFLAENDLLISPDHGVGVSLDDCRELAPTLGLRDGWEVATKFAVGILPQIFRANDPAGRIEFAPEDRTALRALVTGLPRDIFLATDALGWTYQFWQAQRKEDVNASGKKIGADELSPVTQLFTEDYMVDFLLHNTLGAWWAGKVLARDEGGALPQAPPGRRNSPDPSLQVWRDMPAAEPAGTFRQTVADASRLDAETMVTEQDLRELVALPGIEWTYLRFVSGTSEVASASSGCSRPTHAQDGHATSAPAAPAADNADATGTSAPAEERSHQQEGSGEGAPLPGGGAGVADAPGRAAPLYSWRPAAGTFDGWPKTAKELRVLDPCMGSGHFVVFELPILVAIRMAEEGLSVAEACAAVLRDNLFGLELDPRCTQIAAFNLALAAWKLGGYQKLPPMNLACCGLGINARKEDWLKLADSAAVACASSGCSPGPHAQDEHATSGQFDIRQGANLPHWTVEHAIYHVTFRLADSLPAAKLKEWQRERANIVDAAETTGRPLSEDEQRRLAWLFSEKVEQYLDQGEGTCWLARPEVAELVVGALRFFDGQRYRLHAWCVMPSHVHVIVEPLVGHALSQIKHSWTSYTANRANQLLGLTGQFWQHEPYDHIIRSEKEYAFQVRYVLNNPKDAGLVDWQWVSEVASTASGCKSNHALEAHATSGGCKSNHALEAHATSGGCKGNHALEAHATSGGCKGNHALEVHATAEQLRGGMDRLYDLFQQAPVLGSLINPRQALGGGDFFIAEFHDLAPLLETALAQETADEAAHEMAVVAQGLAKAAEILAGQFTLVATNVPYLGRGKQDDTLKAYCERQHTDAKADLATCFVERCLALCDVARASSTCGNHAQDAHATSTGSAALVTPQNWLFLGTYKKLRKALLQQAQWDAVTRLGSHAFETIGGEVVNVALLALSAARPSDEHAFAGLDASAEKTPDAKADALRTTPPTLVGQKAQLGNPDARVGLDTTQGKRLLFDYVDSYEGIGSGDLVRFQRNWWEAPLDNKNLVPFRTTSGVTSNASGCSDALLWEDGKGDMIRNAKEQNSRPTRGFRAWNMRGIAVDRMRGLAASSYHGEKFDCNIAAIIPKTPDHLTAIWSFCTDPSFSAEVRKVDQALKVTNHTLVKVPFDLAHWQQVAAEKYPNGLPKPHSDDPTQWLFYGHPNPAHPHGMVNREVACASSACFPSNHAQDGHATSASLHVAVARLLGYRWPRQTGSSFMDCPALGPDGLEALADADGIVCISAIKGEQPAAERLRALLAAAFGAAWSAARQAELLAQAGYAGKTLDDWLRNGFFEQHCQRFHHRPFVWHIWDGLRDGFSVLVNYHLLDHARLEKLTYTYLGDWIARQKAAVEAGEEGSDAKLAAAQALKASLEKILAGEAPHDIFVRWKPLAQQPLGWNPDLNDGVRLNIRPFLTVPDVGKKGAGILRWKPNLKWEKDRGTEPQRPQAEFPWFWNGGTFTGDRLNDIHLTLEEKRKAREPGTAMG